MGNPYSNLVVLPPKRCEGMDGNSLRYGDNYKGATTCLEALEEANPGRVFYIKIDRIFPAGCAAQGNIPPDYYIEEGLFDSCQEGVVGEFDYWDSFANETLAKKCAHALNRLEAAKGSGLECRAKNIGGVFVNNWEVTCEK